MKNVKTTNFFKTLTRSNTTITEERAKRVARAVMNEYKKRLMSITGEIDTVRSELESLNDLSTSNSVLDINSVKDLNAVEFVDRDSSLALRIMELKLKYDMLKSAYETKFGTYDDDFDLEGENEEGSES